MLYRKAIDAADLKGTETVFDLYCGIGTISLVAAKKAGKVIGDTEVVEEAVETARENATKNKITNAEFHVGTVEDVVRNCTQRVSARMSSLWIRRGKGCDRKLLETIREMKPGAHCVCILQSVHLGAGLEIPVRFL